MESMIAEVAHLNSVEQCVTTANKSRVYFEWIRSTSCSPPRNSRCFVRGVTRINYGVSKHMIDEEATRLRGTKKKMKILAHKSLRK
jgi:hypothetical protein